MAQGGTGELLGPNSCLRERARGWGVCVWECVCVCV